VEVSIIFIKVKDLIINVFNLGSKMQVLKYSTLFSDKLILRVKRPNKNSRW